MPNSILNDSYTKDSYHNTIICWLIVVNLTAWSWLCFNPSQAVVNMLFGWILYVNSLNAWVSIGLNIVGSTLMAVWVRATIWHLCTAGLVLPCFILSVRVLLLMNCLLRDFVTQRNHKFCFYDGESPAALFIDLDTSWGSLMHWMNSTNSASGPLSSVIDARNYKHFVIVRPGLVSWEDLLFLWEYYLRSLQCVSK